MNPGVKAVCIDDSPCRCCGRPTTLQKNSVYVLLATRVPLDGHERVKVLGCTDNCPHSSWEPGWYGAWRFRQLATPEPIKQQEIIHA